MYIKKISCIVFYLIHASRASLIHFRSLCVSFASCFYSCNDFNLFFTLDRMCMRERREVRQRNLVDLIERLALAR